VLSWSTAYTGASSTPQSIAIDFGGSIETVTNATINTGQEVQIQVFNTSTGTNSAHYNYSGAAGDDFGFNIFASPTATGTFYVTGWGESGSTFYPLDLKFVSNALSWHLYV
jgi:hypothetical protein